MTEPKSTVSSVIRLCIYTRFYIYLNFSEDKPVPDGVPPGDTHVELRYFSAESQMQQPFLQWTISLTKYLQRHETSLYSGRQPEKKKDWKQRSRSPRSDLITHAVEQTWNHGKDCWLQCLQIIHQKSNISLEEPNSGPMDENDTLKKQRSTLSTRGRTEHNNNLSKLPQMCP